MLDIQSKRSHRACDGMSRRSMLRVGAVSAMGLTMAEAMARKAHGQEAPAGTKAKSVIQL